MKVIEQFHGVVLEVRGLVDDQPLEKTDGLHLELFVREGLQILDGLGDQVTLVCSERLGIEVDGVLLDQSEGVVELTLP